MRVLTERTLGYLPVCFQYAIWSAVNHNLTMAARDSSSEEVDSSLEDSATTTIEDPISVAKARGADLKEPEKAAIARTRKIQRNKAGGKKTVRGQKDPKVSAYQRVRENQNKYLSITSKNMLRCDTCKETLSKKKSTVRKHINSVKRNDAKRAIQNSKMRDQSLLKFLRVPEVIHRGEQNAIMTVIKFVRIF